MPVSISHRNVATLERPPHCGGINLELIGDQSQGTAVPIERDGLVHLLFIQTLVPHRQTHAMQVLRYRHTVDLEALGQVVDRSSGLVSVH
jgi:hypothetical protein